MKNVIIFLYILLIPLSIVGCGKSEEKPESPSFKKSKFADSELTKDVVLSIKEKQITTKTEELTLIYTNNSKTEYLYGGVDYLEIENDGVWYSVPSKENVQWNNVAYSIPPSGVSESKFPIKTHYGDLDSGKYRVIKKIGEVDIPKVTNIIIAEFILNKIE